MFPGQGSQHLGMGKELIAQSWTDYYLDKAAEVLGWDISRLCLEGPESKLSETSYTQPALYVIDYLYFCHADRNDVKAQIVAGHSLGEIVALAYAGVYDFETGLGLVKDRAALMEEAARAHQGKMVAVVGLTEKEVQQAVEVVSGIGMVAVANYNCPGQHVISGEVAAVDKAAELLLASGAKKAVELAVGGAFHSPLMADAARGFVSKLDQVTFKEAKVPVVSNFTARASRDPATLKEALSNQMTGAVRWQESVKMMISAGVDRISEVGPGKVLRGLIRRIDAQVELEGIEAHLSAQGNSHSQGMTGAKNPSP